MTVLQGIVYNIYISVMIHYIVIPRVPTTEVTLEGEGEDVARCFKIWMNARPVSSSLNINRQFVWNLSRAFRLREQPKSRARATDTSCHESSSAVTWRRELGLENGDYTDVLGQSRPSARFAASKPAVLVPLGPKCLGRNVGKREFRGSADPVEDRSDATPTWIPCSSSSPRRDKSTGYSLSRGCAMKSRDTASTCSWFAWWPLIVFGYISVSSPSRFH